MGAFSAGHWQRHRAGWAQQFDRLGHMSRRPLISLLVASLHGTICEWYRHSSALHQWGPEQFDSGPGSHGEPARIFAECVIDFIKLHNNIRVVVDLGCGNFAVGTRIAPACERYIGVDVVPALVGRNRAMFRGGFRVSRHTSRCFAGREFMHLAPEFQWVSR